MSEFEVDVLENAYSGLANPLPWSVLDVVPDVYVTVPTLAVPSLVTERDDPKFNLHVGDTRGGDVGAGVVGATVVGAGVVGAAVVGAAVVGAGVVGAGVVGAGVVGGTVVVVGT